MRRSLVLLLLRMFLKNSYKEEIVDETDEYVDVHKRIRVAAAAAASSVARAPSHRQLNQKAAGAQTRQGQQPAGILKKPTTEGDSNTPWVKGVLQNIS